MMSPVEFKAYNAGVAAVIALAVDAANRLQSSSISPMRRELAIETLRALASEAASLMRPEVIERG